MFRDRSLKSCGMFIQARNCWNSLDILERYLMIDLLLRCGDVSSLPMDYTSHQYQIWKKTYIVGFYHRRCLLIEEGPAICCAISSDGSKLVCKGNSNSVDTSAVQDFLCSRTCNWSSTVCFAIYGNERTKTFVCIRRIRSTQIIRQINTQDALSATKSLNRQSGLQPSSSQI